VTTRGRPASEHEECRCANLVHVTHWVIRRCGTEDWPEVRRLHIKLALGLPLMVDVDLNEVLATPEGYWQNFTQVCAAATDQALFLADAGGACVGMGHVRLQEAQARLGMLYVEGELRRRGIGSALVEAQESWAHASGAGGLVCHIPEMSAACSLAQKLGWQKTDEIFYTKHRFREHLWAKSRE
jgi:GNAT superfamily N-acetyltransferase